MLKYVAMLDSSVLSFLLSHSWNSHNLALIFQFYHNASSNPITNIRLRQTLHQASLSSRWPSTQKTKPFHNHSFRCKIHTNPSPSFIFISPFWLLLWDNFFYHIIIVWHYLPLQEIINGEFSSAIQWAHCVLISYYLNMNKTSWGWRWWLLSRLSELC